MGAASAPNAPEAAAAAPAAPADQEPSPLPGGSVNLAYLLLITAFHMLLGRLHGAGYLGPPPSRAYTGSLMIEHTTASSAAAAAAAPLPLRRQCLRSEAASLAGGLRWSLEPEATTAHLEPERDGTASLRRADILAWAPGQAPLEFVPHLGAPCSLRAMTPARMRRCLRGRGILFVGDSVTRYQFLGLAQALETGLHVAWDPPTEHDNLFGTWANFFAATTERLGGHAACDCWRPPNDAPQQVCRGGVCAWAVCGSRYYAWPEQRLEATFLEALGGARDPPAAVWHEPAPSFGVHCDKAGGGEGLPACAASGGSGNGDGSGALPPPACAPGWCSSPPDRVEAMWDGIRAAVLRVRPKILVLNSGLWGVQWRAGEGGNVAALLAALDWAASAEGGVEEVVWKTTTHQLHGESGAFDDTPLKTQQEQLVVAGFRERGWAVLDAAEATAELAALATASEANRTRIFMDAVHFTRNIYRGLNEVLLSMVCREEGEGEGGQEGAHSRSGSASEGSARAAAVVPAPTAAEQGRLSMADLDT